MSFKDHGTKRPRRDHPNPIYWSKLRKRVLKKQNFECATCPATAEDYALDLHHRHYDNFGKEKLKDVVILCRMCHDSITSRLRSSRTKEEMRCEPVKSIAIEERITYEKPRF